MGQKRIKEKSNKLQILRQVRGDGLAHGPPNNVPQAKCNYNKKWTGWIPEWVCKKIWVDFKEYDKCSK